MNIEIANRLVELRKANNLSQEALAEKLGISRQAVSKWERAEASPDTDNLILLARLYNVSLDELLKTDEEIDPMNGGENEQSSGNDDEYVDVGFGGIHVKDKKGEVHVGWDGIHVTDKGDEVHIDGNGIDVNGEGLEEHIFKYHKQADFPIGLITMVIYLIMGFVWNLWHPGWLIFFMVPIISSLIEACKRKSARKFAYPVLVVLIYLYLGVVERIWHPTWLLYLTIPVYYEVVKFFENRKKEN